MAESQSKPAPRSRAQIQADLDGARSRLSGNLEDLIDRVHPSRIKDREIDKVKELAQAEIDNVKSQVINPDGSPRIDRIALIGGAVAGFVTFVLVIRAIGRRAARGSSRLIMATSETTGDLPIRMLHDRVLVSTEGEQGERRSGGGILIPATVEMGRRLAWAKVVATGAHVRTVKVDDRVLFDPADKAEVEVRSKDYLLLRERDLHAVAAEGLEDGKTGLYL